MFQSQRLHRSATRSLLRLRPPLRHRRRRRVRVLRLVDVASVQWTSAESARVHGVLRRLYGNRVRSPTPELAVALRSLLVDPSQSLLAVLPTGAGKSALLFADALADGTSSGVVVVVTPLRALAEQTRKLCARVGVPCSVFGATTAGALATDTRVVLVAPELVGTPEFRFMLGGLSDQHRLRRIIVDEAHQLACNSVLNEGFRPKLLRALRDLRGQHATVPVLLLSATVPPALAQTLQAEAELPDLLVVRAASTRPNLRLTVVTAPGSSDAAVEEASVAEAADRVARCSPEDRVIVLVRSVAAVGRVARDLRHALRKANNHVFEYHGELDAPDQLASAAAWAAKTGAASVMVATSGFGTGVDYAHVRAVVHVGGANSVLDLVQELGHTHAKAVHVLVAPVPFAVSFRVARSFTQAIQCRDVAPSARPLLSFSVLRSFTQANKFNAAK